MKQLRLLFFPVLLALSLLSEDVAAQSIRPDHQFAVRLNVLGVLNFNAIGEIEYLFSDRLGVYVGGGVSAPIMELGNINWFSKGGFNVQAGGVYAGARVGLPIGKAIGLAVKPSIVYGRYGKAEGDVIPAIPQQPVTLRQYFGTYLSLAYAQHLGSRLFIEPVLGVGPSFGQWDGETGLKYMGFSAPIQLNFGFRF